MIPEIRCLCVAAVKVVVCLSAKKQPLFSSDDVSSEVQV